MQLMREFWWMDGLLVLFLTSLPQIKVMIPQK